MPTSLSEILGYITNLITAWGIMQFVQAGVFIVITISVLIGIKNALQK
jgi:hypothetical protein